VVPPRMVALMIMMASGTLGRAEKRGTESRKWTTGNTNGDLEGFGTDAGRDHVPADRGFSER
jgi:hypothetical protein